MTDSLKAAWSDQSKQAAFLLQQLAAPVPPGCTPLAQPTDTHFAKPAKDAGRQKKDELRELMRLAAARAGQAPSYQSGAREILQVCNAMQTAMQDLAASRDMVLQACRSTGWLAYRPDETGQLQRADREPWAACLPLAGGRASQAQLANRFSWLDSQGRPTLPDRQAGQLPSLPAWVAEHSLPDEAPDQDSLCLDMEPAVKRQLLHPRDRQDETLEEALAKLTPQGKQVLSPEQRQALQDRSEKKRQSQKSKAKKQLRSALVSHWRDELARAGGVKQRLKQLPPGTAGSAKRARKQQKKHRPSAQGPGSLPAR